MKSTTFNKLYHYGSLFTFLLIPSGFYQLILAVLLFVFICWVVKSEYKLIPKIITRPEIFLPALLYLYIAAGIFFSSNFNDALSSLSTKLPLIIFPIIFGSSAIIQTDLINKGRNLFIISLILCLAAALIYALFDTIETRKMTILINEAIYNKFSWYGLTRLFDNWHPTYVSMFVNLSISILFSKLINGEINKFRVWVIILILFLMVSLFLLYSLIGIITMLLLAIYHGIIYCKSLKYSNARVVLIICALSLFFAFLFYFNPLKLDKIESLKNKEWKITDNQNERNLLTMRVAKWQTHINIIKKYWLFGTTAGDINQIRQNAYIASGFPDLAKYNYNAHNEYLEVFATYGIIGFVLFMTMLIVPLFKRNYPDFLPFLIIIMTASFTESILNRQQGILFFIIMYTIYTKRESIAKYKSN